MKEEHVVLISANEYERLIRADERLEIIKAFAFKTKVVTIDDIELIVGMKLEGENENGNPCLGDR